MNKFILQVCFDTCIVWIFYLSLIESSDGGLVGGLLGGLLGGGKSHNGSQNGPPPPDPSPPQTGPSPPPPQYHPPPGPQAPDNCRNRNGGKIRHQNQGTGCTQAPVTQAPSPPVNHEPTQAPVIHTTESTNSEKDHLPFNISLACFTIDEKELDDKLTSNCCHRVSGTCKRFATEGREIEGHCLGKIRKDEIDFDFCCRMTRGLRTKVSVYHANITESQSKLIGEPNCEVS